MTNKLPKGDMNQRAKFVVDRATEQRKQPLPADYGDATPEQVAKAFIKYRPKLAKPQK